MRGKKVADEIEPGCPSNAQMCPYTRKAADQAVKQVFAILGVDVDKPESVEEFREDLRFGKRMRKAADHGWLVLIGLIVVGLSAAMWAGIVAEFRKAATGG